MKKKIGLKDIAGFKISAVKAGIKASGSPDLGLIVADDMAVGSAVFTQNKVCAAPVKLSKANLKKNKGYIKAVVVNAGNANACTGTLGIKNAKACATLVAQKFSTKMESILLCSTGIIGEHLPMKKITDGITKSCLLINNNKTDAIFSKAIMTTDTVNKELGTTVNIGRKKIMIAGAAKGVGMIAPNMATMLGFLLSDIAIAPKVLNTILKEVVDDTFNCVTVDGDTSTNDTCIALTSGSAGNKIITSTKSEEAQKFKSALREVSYELAKKIARDGEGATTLIRVLVKNAGSRKGAYLIGKSIAESPLVKTAIAGNDPNWGRMMMAAGKSGVNFNESKVSISISGIKLFAKGAPLKFSHSKAVKALKKKEVTIDIDLGKKNSGIEILTCDLTHGYIEINADYHT